jgi:hypothetical protein
MMITVQQTSAPSGVAETGSGLCSSCLFDKHRLDGWRNTEVRT